MSNQQPRPERRDMLFLQGGRTQGFNTFLTVRNSGRRSGGVLNPFGANKAVVRLRIVLYAVLVCSSCASKEIALEEPPIITSATYQHTQYNGGSQPIEARAAKDDAPPFVITYFRSEEDLEQDRGGSTEPPFETGGYYVRIERPAGNGYRQGRNIKIEYHIQKAFVSIIADPVKRAAWDGGPKEITARIEPSVEPPLIFSYFAANDPDGKALESPPGKRGRYRVTAVFPGNERYMGASKEIELWIE
jgi:hypothetical protein